MTQSRFLQAGTIQALAVALGLSAPAQAQDRDFSAPRRGNAERIERQPDQPRERGRAWGQSEADASGGERAAVSARQAAPASAPRASWGGAQRMRSENASERAERRDARSQAPVAATAPTRNVGYGADRNVTYTAPRDGSYGATTRSRDWAAQHRGGDSGTQRTHPPTGWSRSGDGDGDARHADWRRNRSDEVRSADWQRDRREDARRDDSRDSAHGYRDGRRVDQRTDHRWGQNHRRWDNRAWRNDHRYDWYRHRAANRSLFSLGRYYAPYRGYGYSRISIGFHLGSPFYSNRYWINDPWRYRLPDVYGPYRWVRYYDDALLVDLYSGEVVDVIHNFFW